MANSSAPGGALLGEGDPAPVAVLTGGEDSPLLLLGDHAGRAIPERLGRLGLPKAALDRHIAWDIGVGGLGVLLAEALRTTFIAQAYSRLVIDCNRRPGSEGSVAEVSDGISIPGNTGLSPGDLKARHDEIYRPYHAAVARTLDARAERPTILVSLHSFTPSMQGRDRPWTYGVLHRDDSAFSQAVLALMQAEIGDLAGDNQPYRMDEVDNTIPLHADSRGLDYLELEVRQDLLETPAGQRAAADWLTRILQRALATVS